MIFDLLAVGVILLGFALGAWKGFAWQLAGILSLLAGFAVGLPLSKIAAPVFGSVEPLNRFIALAVIYAIVSLGIYVGAFTYRRTIEKWQLQHWDRHLGSLMGGIKGFLLCLTLTFFAITLISPFREPLLTTRMGWVMARTMDLLHPVWPDEAHKIIHPYIHHLDEPPPEREPDPATPPTPPEKHEEPKTPPEHPQ